MNQRKFLLKFKFWARYLFTKRKLRRVQNLVVESNKAHEKELHSIRSHYEKLLAEQGLKIEALSLSIADRTLEAFKLLNVSHTVSNLADKAAQRVDPGYWPTPPPEEDALSGDEHDFFLDLKDGFFEAERANGRSEPEITRLWNETFKAKAIQQARESILQ